MTIEFIDESGEPRSDQSIIETIDAIKKEIVQGRPAPIMVFYPTILDALRELLEMRKYIRRKDGYSR